MTEFREFNHLRRLGDTQIEGILNGVCYITPKIDGTNSSVWFNGEVCGGSRKRELDLYSDNAGFYNWLESAEDEEAVLLGDFVTNNPTKIIYGEWGLGKVGNIKDYDPEAKGKLWIFDIYDIELGHYIHYNDIITLLKEWNLDKYLVPILAIVDDPTEEQLLEIANNNKFLLENANHPGEGIVIRNYDFRDYCGHYHIAKLVLDEFKQKKGERKNKVPSKRTDCEEAIVETYCTDAEISKAVAKVTLACGEKQFDNRNGKMVGMLLNMVFNDLLEENILDICKKWKRPVINFQTLQNLTFKKTRSYIEL